MILKGANNLFLRVYRRPKSFIYLLHFYVYAIWRQQVVLNRQFEPIVLFPAMKAADPNVNEQDFTARSDLEWIRELKQNNQIAIADLWEMLYVFAWNMGKRKGLEPDLVQDAAVAAYQRILKKGVTQYRFQCPFAGFCHRIVVNECYRLCGRRELRLVGLETIETQNSHSLETEVDTDRIAQRIAPCRELLPEREQTILDSFYFRNQTPQQIADKLDLARNYVNQLAHRARLKIRRCLEKRGFDSAESVIGL